MDGGVVEISNSFFLCCDSMVIEYTYHVNSIKNKTRMTINDKLRLLGIAKEVRNQLFFNCSSIVVKNIPNENSPSSESLFI